MTLRQTIIDDVAAVLLDTDEFAQAVTYTPVGGAAAAITAVFEEGEEQVQDERDGRLIMRVGVLGVALADVASPARDDVAAIAGDDWTVTRVLSREYGWARLEVSRPELREKSTGRLRIKR